MSDSDRQILDAFIDNIWIEKGLSQNTLDSYKSDLEQFSIWLEKNHPLGEIIGGICQRIAHGETLAIVYPAFLEYKEKIATEKFRNIASYLGIEKNPKALTNEVIGLLKTTDLIRSKSRAAITLNEQEEILSHPLLKKLDPKNSEKILSIMSQSIEE